MAASPPGAPALAPFTVMKPSNIHGRELGCLLNLFFPATKLYCRRRPPSPSHAASIYSAPPSFLRYFRQSAMGKISLGVLQMTETELGAFSSGVLRLAQFRFGFMVLEMLCFIGIGDALFYWYWRCFVSMVFYNLFHYINYGFVKKNLYEPISWYDCHLKT